MADERLDDLERRVRELEARVAGLREERKSLEETVAAVGGPFGANATADPEATDEGAQSSAAAWTDPALRSGDRAEQAGETGDGDREVVMAPPKGASQAAVEQAVDEMERTREHEENLVM